MRWLHRFSVGGLAIAILGCAPPTNDPNRTTTSTDFERNKAVFTPIATAGVLTLYEGLPHQLFEAEQLEKEKKGKQSVEIHGYPFYREPIAVSAEDQKQLQAILGSADSFEKWAGERKCGGFHPDYLAEWKAGPSVSRVLICFGCGEVKAYGPDHALRSDIKSDVKTKLRDVLAKYQKNRPQREGP
jgi:hypothetical protein